MMVKVEFWDVTPYNVDIVFRRTLFPSFSGRSDGGSKVPPNVVIISQQYTALQPRRPRLESSPSWKPHISHHIHGWTRGFIATERSWVKGPVGPLRFWWERFSRVPKYVMSLQLSYVTPFVKFHHSY